MRKPIILSALLLGSTVLMAAPSLAAPRPHPRANFHHVIVRHPHRFVLRHDFHHFTPAERRWWIRGHWRHRWWHGRYGWWWNVGGIWYFYNAPVYPYPTVVSSDYYDEDYDDEDYDNSGSDNDQYGPPGSEGGAGVWYHCSKPEGYYPYVKNCSGGWEQVPATPDDMQGAPDDMRGAPGDMQGASPDEEDNGPPPPDDQGDDEDDQGPPPPPH
jgi:hypothetical protein